MHVFVVLNQSSLFTTHKSYVGLILIIKFITLICFWVNHNNSLLYKKFPLQKELATKTKKHPGGKLNGGSISFLNQQIKSKEGILRLIATKRHSRKLSLTSDRLIYVITIKSNINLLAVDLVGNINYYNKIRCFMVHKILFSPVPNDGKINFLAMVRLLLLQTTLFEIELLNRWISFANAYCMRKSIV